MATEATLPPSREGWFARLQKSDLGWSFFHSPRAMASLAVVLLLVLAALLAPWISPQNPLDLASLDLSAALTPPAWLEGGSSAYPLGTDGQGRDLLSAILYGMRTSLVVGLSATVFAIAVGVTLGLLAGYAGGFIDMAVMRLADIQWSFPAILIALLVDGVARNVLPRQRQEEIALYVLVLAIGVSGWVQFARTVRGSTLAEKNKEYVQAARVTGVHPLRIMFGHVLPNTLGPVLVIATIYLAVAIIVEATLSFLGVGVPATQPSLGTLIRIGSNMLMSGEWWVTLFPALTLAALVLAVNVLGDWLRDTLNPRLKA